ncbi:hypothetical protein BDZ89DRAFT_1072126 [Hymenopellis radicata]|nr:hypothetical protein BDZ89DRAFT_1072126 [Hymenopellis radicata]
MAHGLGTVLRYKIISAKKSAVLTMSSERTVRSSKNPTNRTPALMYRWRGRSPRCIERVYHGP